MKNTLKLIPIALCCLSLTGSGLADTSKASANQCIFQGNFVNTLHHLQSNSIDPYSHLLGEIENVNSLGTSYDLDLKPLLLNDVTKLQFETYDSRSPAAGYTSPYLWDVGQGPGYRSPFQPWNGAPQPGPMPIRR